MKSFTYAVMMTGMLASTAMAAQVEWRGGLCVTTANATCLADGWVVGECFVLRFLPPNLGDNGPSTRLTFLAQHFAEQYTLDSGNLESPTFLTVRETSIGRFGFQSDVPMRLSELLPDPILVTTKSISMTGIIRNASGTPGCTLGFRGSAALKPQ